MAEGYQMSNGRFASARDVTLQASASYSATANGSWVEIGDRGVLRLLLDVTACTGTCDVSVYTARDSAGTGSRTLGAFTQATGVTSEWKSFSGCDRFARVVVTIGTGPSVFSCAGDAV